MTRHEPGTPARPQPAPRPARTRRRLRLRATRRRPLAVLLTLALAALTTVATARTAGAVESPVVFSAVDLPTWQTDGIAWTVAAAQGRAFVGGTFTKLRPPATDPTDPAALVRTNFAVLEAVSGKALPCAPAFERPAGPSLATVRATAVSPDGQTLYVAGTFTRAGGVEVSNLAALDIATCTIVSSFRPAVDGQVRALAVTATRVYLGGEFSRVNGTYRGRVAAVTAVGTPSPGQVVTSWVPAPDDDVDALAVSPDGRYVVLGGVFVRVNGLGSNAVAVVNTTTGSVAKAYPGFIQTRSHVKDIATDSSGFYLANEGDGPGVFDGRLAIDWSTLGERWRDTCLGATQSVLAWRGVVYSASHAHNCASVGEFPDGGRHHLLAQSTTGTAKLAWFPNTNDGMGEGIGPRDLALARTTSSGDFLFAVGEFTTVNGHAQVGITRFAATPDAGPVSLKLSVTSFKTGKINVAWRTALDADNITLSYSLYRDGERTPIWTTTRASTFWSRPQLTFVDTQPAGSRHSYQVVATDGVTSVSSPTRWQTAASADSAYAARVLADGATLFWRYDDPADIFVSDSSPTGDNGTIRGGTTFGAAGALPGEASTALTMNGNGAVVYSDRRAPGPTRLSVETWFATTTRSGGKIVGFGDKYEIKSYYYDRHLYMSNTGQVNWGVEGFRKTVVTSPRTYNDGAWHHLVGTLDNGRIALYIDGQLIGTATSGTPSSYVGQWHVGDDAASSWPGSPSVSSPPGTWDETAIYPVALSSAQVAAHYAYGRRGGPPRP